MPATTLDSKIALVVIDLQRGLASYPTVHPFAGVVEKAARLAAAFREAALPVVLVNVGFSPDGADWLSNRTELRRPLPSSPGFSELVPELDAQPSDLRITKRQPNAFYGTELELQLRRRQITNIVLCGVATSIGVDGTARAAHERGFNVTFASDAMTDVDAATHELVLSKVFPRLGEIDTTAAVLALLASRSKG